VKAALLCFAPFALSGCIGLSSYDIHPYYETATGQETCCAVTIHSGRDVQSATVDVTKYADGTIVAHYTENGVSASAPISANAVTASAVAGAVTQSAITAAKFAPP
jgi:hypothetical protein